MVDVTTGGSVLSVPRAEMASAPLISSAEYSLDRRVLISSFVFPLTLSFVTALSNAVLDMFSLSVADGFHVYKVNTHPHTIHAYS